MPQSSRIRSAIQLAALLLATFAAVGVIHFADLRLSMGWRIAILVGIAIPAFWLVVRYWADLDEVAKEAQKWAWFWGGSLGMGAGLIAVSVKPLGLARLMPADATAAQLMAYGGMTVMIASLWGFTIAWAIWWATRR